MAIPLRAHNLLCLLGYRGRGYDEAFVREMSSVHRAVTSDAATEVEVLASPDRLCRVCPNLAPDGCRLRGAGHEAHMRRQDEDVARRLGLRVGGTYRWSEVLARVSSSVRGADLPAICTTCPWLPLGWCAEGVDAVAAANGGRTGVRPA